MARNKSIDEIVKTKDAEILYDTFAEKIRGAFNTMPPGQAKNWIKFATSLTRDEDYKINWRADKPEVDTVEFYF